MLPFEKEGIKSQSIGFLVPAESATVWRGPYGIRCFEPIIK